MTQEEAAMRQRIGKFSISLDLVKNEPALVRLIMAQTIILQAAAIAGGSIAYIALCPAFDEVDVSGELPSYHPITHAGDFLRWDRGV